MMRQIAIYGGGLLLVALAGWWVVSTIMGQAGMIATQREQLDQRAVRIEELQASLEKERRQHEQEIVARDRAVEVQRQQARAARQRAETLAGSIDQARGRDGDVDACMGMQLPDAVADSLRQ